MAADRSKFNVSKSVDNRTLDGIVFDSRLEMSFYRDWVLPRLASGEIVDCQLQVKYTLLDKFVHENQTVRPILYVADFVITDKNGHVAVIDTKGQPDSAAKLKRKLFWHRYPEVDYRWIGYSKIDGGWVDYETILAGRKRRRQEKRAQEKAHGK